VVMSALAISLITIKLQWYLRDFRQTGKVTLSARFTGLIAE
jgi:hypothetical protein